MDLKSILHPKTKKDNLTAEKSADLAIYLLDQMTPKIRRKFQDHCEFIGLWNAVSTEFGASSPKVKGGLLKEITKLNSKFGNLEKLDKFESLLDYPAVS